MKVLNVRMNDEDYNKIVETAEKLGLSVSDYIRFLTTAHRLKIDIVEDK